MICIVFSIVVAVLCIISFIVLSHRDNTKVLSRFDFLIFVSVVIGSLYMNNAFTLMRYYRPNGVFACQLTYNDVISDSDSVQSILDKCESFDRLKFSYRDGFNIIDCILTPFTSDWFKVSSIENTGEIKAKGSDLEYVTFQYYRLPSDIYVKFEDKYYGLSSKVDLESDKIYTIQYAEDSDFQLMIDDKSYTAYEYASVKVG